MSTNGESKHIEQLMAEADALIQQIQSNILDEMQEEHRLQFDLQAQKLERIKSEMQGRVESADASRVGSGATGIHEAILDIVKAMRGLSKSVS